MPKYFRTCTACGHEQPRNDPAKLKEITDSWRNTKCRKCRSEALDWGSYIYAFYCDDCASGFDTMAELSQHITLFPNGACCE